MWQQVETGQSTLWLNIHGESSHVYHFSLTDNRRGPLVRNATVQLAEEEYANLQRVLDELTRQGGPANALAFGQLGHLLFRLVLPQQIQDVLGKHAGPLVFATEELSLPWELLHDGTRFLCLDQPFARLPESYQLADVLFGTEEPAANDERVLLIADPADNLPAAAGEAEELKALFARHGVPCDVLCGPKQCTFLNIMDRLTKGGYDIVHYAGHVQYFPDRQTSAMVLADKQFLPAQSICKGLRGNPLVFLNACHAAVHAAGTAGGPQRYGAHNVRTLAQAFAHGNKLGRARVVLGSMWWIDDDVARGMAVKLYDEILAGTCLGEALRRARAHIAATQRDPALWSSYVLFGDPLLAVQRGPRPTDASVKGSKTSPDVGATVRRTRGFENDTVPLGHDAPVTVPLAHDKPSLAVNDNVQFTVYRPRTVRPEEWNLLVAFAHLDDPDTLKQVEQAAQQALGDLAETSKSEADAKQAVARGSRLLMVPHVPGLTFDPPLYNFVWLEPVHRANFRFQAAAELDGKMARGALKVFLGAVVLAEVSLSIRVDKDHEPAAATTPPTDAARARPYRKIFASYSHKDTAVVEQFERYGKALGDTYVRDWIQLRAGEVWNDRLMQMIEEADVFQLFWSTNALASPFVEQEWRYALGLNRPNFIRPVYWEEPLPRLTEKNLPPNELSRLHFQLLPADVCTPPPPPPKPAPAAKAKRPELPGLGNMAELAEGLPWSDDVRVALLGSVATMYAMNWSVFSTVHLLLGLTYLEKGLINRALIERGHDPQKARRALRKVLEQDKGARATKGFDISPNLRQTLTAAKTLASEAGADEVTERHLVLAALEQPESAAVTILNALQVDTARLRKQLRQGPGSPAALPEKDVFRPDDTLDETRFEPECRAALGEAAEMALRTYWTEIRSPHLFLGMLHRPASALADRLQEIGGLSVSELTDTFFRVFGKPPRAGWQKPKLDRASFSENACDVLRRALNLAANSGQPRVRERDLLQVIVLDEGNIVAQVLRKLKINPASLLPAEGK